jgi:hypothetical protein
MILLSRKRPLILQWMVHYSIAINENEDDGSIGEVLTFCGVVGKPLHLAWP